MSINVSFQITAFEITNCRLDCEEPIENAVLKAFSGFAKWVNSAEHVEDTLIEGAQGVYVKDVAQLSGIFSIVLWKQNGARNTTYALSKSDPPDGTASISSKRFGSDYIPGDPLYFIVNSETKRLYTLRPPFAVRTGRIDLEDAVKFYMMNHSEFVKKTIGIENGIETVFCEPASPLRPAFNSKLVRNDAALKDIIAKRESIRKLVKEVSIKSHDGTMRTKVLRPLVAMFSGKLAENEFDNARKVRCEVDVGLNEEQIISIVDEQENSPSQRVGFKFKNDSTIHWADKCIDRQKVPLTFDENTGVFSANNILIAFKRFLGQ